jgi:hypothetical protein
MLEPAVTLTDYALTVESLVFAFLLHGRPGPSVWARNLFLALALSSGLGGTYHGFCGDLETMGGQLTWRLTLVAIGVVALACWQLSATFYSTKFGPWIERLSLVVFLGYGMYVTVFSQDFRVAILNYLPPVFFLLFTLIRAYVQTHQRFHWWSIAGLILTFIAAGIQQTKVALSPAFDHNAIYHLVQAVALALIFVGLRRYLLHESPGNGAHRSLSH